MRSAISKYLHTAAESGTFGIDGFGGDRMWDAAVVVPIRDEPEDWWTRVLGERDRASRLLLIAVVNESRDSSPESRRRNTEAIAALRREPMDTRSELGLTLGNLDERLDVLVVDRTRSRAFDPGAGVGLARKLGFDLALALVHQGRLRSPFLHGTDADATMPRSHLVEPPLEVVARTASFWHHPSSSPPIDEAVALYELWLRHYVTGLRWAGSPYAHHSIGSCISVRAEAYARVRGVPKRQAGEDFHLLAKLAKQGPIARTSPQPVALESRASLRVPFGTGRAALDHARGTRPILFYDPSIFELLGNLLQHLREIETEGDVLAVLQAQPKLLRDALTSLGAPDGMLRACSSATTPEQRRRRIMEWLDALRTLKLVHALRDRGLASRPWSEVATRTPWLEGGPDVESARRALDTFEQRVEPIGVM